MTLNAAQAAAMDSSSVPDLTVFLEYSMDGMAKSTDYTLSPSQTIYSCSLGGGNSSVSLSAEAADVDYGLVLQKQNRDTHNYSAEFREVRILWYETGKDTPAGETVIWDGSGSSPFTGSGASYSYSDTIPLAPPGPDIDRFALRFTARIYGNDNFDKEGGFEQTHTTNKYTLPDGS